MGQTIAYCIVCCLYRVEAGKWPQQLSVPEAHNLFLFALSQNEVSLSQMCIPEDKLMYALEALWEI